jgi:hypothetical protein
MIAILGILAACNAVMTGILALILLGMRAPWRSCLSAIAVCLGNIAAVVAIAAGSWS